MYLLILGLALWAGAHFFKRLAPAVRAKMGASGKALVAALSVLAIVLMVMGYHSTCSVSARPRARPQAGCAIRNCLP